MRQHNKYLEKVYEEMDVYRQHLHTGKELSPQQAETFEKIDVVRGWLRDGFSDVDVIKLAKNDPRLKVQDRRAREILAMAYEVFAELRQLRNRDGIKFMYADIFRNAGQMILNKAVALLKPIEPDEDIDIELKIALMQANSGYSKEVALLMREYTRVMREAAIIDGAYDTSKTPDEQKKKPTKIIIKRKTVIKDGVVESDELNEQANYELSE